MRRIFSYRPVIHQKIMWLLLFSVFSLAFVSWLIYNSKNNIERANADIGLAYESIYKIQDSIIWESCVDTTSAIGRIRHEAAIDRLHRVLTDQRRLLADRQRLSRVANDRTAAALVLGRVAGFLLVVIILIQLNKDISRRKKAEAAQLQDELKYRNLVENAGVVIYSTDLEGHISFVSNKGAALTGYSTAELEGQHFSVLVEPSWLPTVTDTYVRQFREGIPETTLTFVIITQSGQLKWVEQFAVLIFDRKGPIGFQCMVKDISEKKRMELELENSAQQLKESQLWLQSILDNTTSLIYIKDLQGRYILANRRFKEVFNVTDEQFIGRTDFDFSRKNMAENYRRLDDEVIRTRKSMEVEEVIAKPGGDLHFLLVKFPLLDRDDKVFAISGIGTDITERVHIHHQLVAAIGEAEEAKQMEEQFLANMSHEIRTPMNGIKGMTDLLSDTPLSEKQRELTGIIKQSVNNLVVIVNDILDFSKIKAGKLNMEQIPFRLREVVKGAASTFDHRIKKKGLALHLNVDPEIPEWLMGDPHRLNQVLINLLGNALKFTDRGHISLLVEQKEPSEDGNILLFSVADTGIGIAPESLPTIFDSFSQAGTDISRKYGGTGLGLTICKQLVELQGGEISVSSEIDRGTVFQFRLPYAISEDPGIRGAGALSQANGGNADTGQMFAGRRFLIVEDNEINQRLIDYVLTKAGANVTLAGNGVAAIDILENDPVFDLIIMDLQMPEMDGYEATRHIRKKMSLTMPIIAMTATAMKGEQLRCLEVGMNDYMTKPFEFAELYKRIKGLLAS